MDCCDIGNRDLQMVHDFLKKMYYEYVDTHEDMDNLTRLRWSHALQTVGSIGYQYKVERKTREFVGGDYMDTCCCDCITDGVDTSDDENMSRQIDFQGFAPALELMKKGYHVRREEWKHDHSIYLYEYDTGDMEIWTDDPVLTCGPWKPTIEDILAKDWILVV